jgi:TrmH family RNA methyltransferase
MEFPKKAALVVSNEANGPQLIKQGDKMVKIPLYQEAESLNVAIAAGILLYAIKTSR